MLSRLINARLSYVVLFHFVMGLVFVLILPGFASASSCKSLLASEIDLVGEGVWNVRWSAFKDYNLEIEPGIRRVGRESLRYKYDEHGLNIVSIEVVLQDSKVHTIKVSKGARDIIPDVTRDLIDFIRLDLVPISMITNLKEVNFDLLNRVAGCVSCFSPRKISLNLDGEQVDIVFAHELGHVTHFHTKWFHFRWVRAIKKDGNQVSEYGSLLTVEDFAETFAMYLDPDPDLHRQYRERFPNRFALMDSVLRRELHTSFSGQRFLPSPDPYMAGAFMLMAASIPVGLVISIIDALK